MNLLKNLSITFFVSIIFIKILDIGYGYINSYDTVSKGNSITTRSIVLREWGQPGVHFVSPTKKYQKNASGLELKEYKINIDSDGFITSSNIKYQNDSQNADIIFFGGSTTEGLFVNEEDRFPAVVEKNLSNVLNKKIKVLNSGVSGNHAFHSILLLQSKGFKYKPKIAVLMNNVNDYSLLSKTGSYFSAPPDRSIIDEGKDNRKWFSYKVLRNIKNILIPHIYDGLLRNFKYLLFDPPDDFEGFRDGQVYSPLEAVKEYENTILSFVGLCKSWNIAPVLMTQAHRIGPNTERHSFAKVDEEMLDFYWRYHKIFNEKMREIAKKENVKLIDIEKSIMNGNKKYIYDTVHFNSIGSKKVGDLISENLIQFF